MKIRHLLLTLGLVMSLFSTSFARESPGGGWTQGSLNTEDTNLSMIPQGAAGPETYCSTCDRIAAYKLAQQTAAQRRGSAPSTGGGEVDGDGDGQQ